MRPTPEVGDAVERLIERGGGGMADERTTSHRVDG